MNRVMTTHSHAVNVELRAFLTRGVFAGGLWKSVMARECLVSCVLAYGNGDVGVGVGAGGEVSD
jgi:hypothetical protein